jgi:outer membrane protein OmpA-like peptidoglycan-associated protein/tetratricopeptide (TPR) repeat protein
MHRLPFRLLILLMLMAPAVSHAQWRPVASDFFEEAEDHFHYEEFDRALPLYLRIGSAESLSAFVKYRAGICYLHIPGSEHLSIPFLESALENLSLAPLREGMDTDSSPPDVLLHIGIAYRYIGETEKSLHHLDQLIDITDDPFLADAAEREKEKTQVSELFRKNAGEYTRFEVASEIGLQDDDFNIVISNSGESIVFLRPLKFYDGLFYSFLEDGSWQKPQNITPQVGSDGDVLPLFLTHDGQSMLLYRQDPATNGDIYLSRLDRGKWSRIERLPEPINTRYYESHATLSPDGNELYFSSNRPGGYGGLDIYHSIRDEQGNWSEPLNLGIGVNTMEDEISPRVSEDGNVLFFSSKGHTGMGGYDVFISRRSEDGQWLQAWNPGYPLNTSGQDRFFSPSPNLEKAWYESFVHEQSVRGRLIGIRGFPTEQEFSAGIRVQIAGWHKDLPLSYPSLTVMNSGTGQLILREDFPAGENILDIDLEPGRYELMVHADKYLAVREQISIDSYYPEDLRFEISLEPLTSTVEIGTIHFRFDKDLPDPAEWWKLDDLLALLRDYPSLKISVSGFTDITGNAVYNKLLAGRRANAVKSYMVSEGIAESRIVVHAIGADQFIAPNNTPEGRMLNRRVEAEIINCPDFIQVKHLE